MAPSAMGLKLGFQVFAHYTRKNKCIHDLCVPCGVYLHAKTAVDACDIRTWQTTVILKFIDKSNTGTYFFEQLSMLRVVPTTLLQATDLLEWSCDRWPGICLTAHNWRKWKRAFLTRPCHKIYRDEAVGLKSGKYTWKIMVFVKMWNLRHYRENLIFCQ